MRELARSAVLAAALALAPACGKGSAAGTPAPVRPANAEPWTVARLVPRTSFDPTTFYPSGVGSPYVPDPHLGLVLEPNFSGHWDWPEHRADRFDIRTNNLGLLEDEPTSLEPHGLRILVAGDSHLMVASPSELFPNVLEATLRADGFEGCEVLANGVGYTCPTLYLRRFEHFLELGLAPDAFVVSLFAGNDFFEELQLAYDFNASLKAQDKGYAERLERAKDRCLAALFQGLNQAHFFKHWPGTEERAFELVLARLEAARALCAQRGMLFAVVILPTKIDVDVEDEPRARARALKTLELTEEEGAVAVRLAERLTRTLEDRGVPCVDPTAAMRAEPTPYYWRKDHHLSVDGHARIARALAERIEPLLRERSSQRER